MDLNELELDTTTSSRSRSHSHGHSNLGTSNATTSTRNEEHVHVSTAAVLMQTHRHANEIDGRDSLVEENTDTDTDTDMDMDMDGYNITNTNTNDGEEARMAMGGHDSGHEDIINMNNSHEHEHEFLTAVTSTETLALPEPEMEQEQELEPEQEEEEEPTIIPIPPPRQSEQTAREQLIERERQARLERERARLKRQLARLRARDEEDEAFADADIARVNSDDSIANTHTDRSGESYSMGMGMGMGMGMHEHDLNADVSLNLGGHGHGHDHGDGDGDGDLDISMSMDTDMDLDVNMHMHMSDAHAMPGNGGNVRMASRGESAEGHGNGNNLHVNEVGDEDEDDKSLACTMGRDEDDESNHDNIDVEGHRGIGMGIGCQGEGNGDSIRGDTHGTELRPSPSPLGFTMERFLQDGVVVRENETRIIANNGIYTHVNRNRRGGEENVVDMLQGDVDAENADMNVDVNMTVEHQHPPLMDLGSGNLPLIVPPVMPSTLSIEPAASSIIVDQLTSPYPTSSNYEREGGPTPTHTEENRSNDNLDLNIRVPSPVTVLNASSLEPREEPPDDHDGPHVELTPDAVARIANIESSDDNSSDRGSNLDIAISQGQSRLAQLSEAEILESAEIDYASVGNMPPRSVRDERHLPDISGMSSAFSDQTRTTILESVSATTIDTRTSSAEFGEGCSHTRVSSSSIDMDLNINMDANSSRPIDDDDDDDDGGPTPNVSPIHNRHHTHNTVGVPSIPPSVESLLSPVSDTSLDVQGSEGSIERSIISDSDRKPAALPIMPPPKPIIHELKLEDDIEDEGEHSEWPGTDGHDAIEETVVVMKESSGSTGSYALPNRAIRPGMIKIPPPPSSRNHKDRSSAKGTIHRRVQTTPNFTNFVDDFDYCKYDDGHNNGHSSKRPPTMYSPLYDESDLGHSTSRDASARPYVNNNSGSVIDSNQHTNANYHNGHSLNDGIGNAFAHYGSMNGHGQGHERTMDNLEEGEILCQPLVINKSIINDEVVTRDDMVDSVFSSVRSLSTADLEAEINDCDDYLASSIFARAFPERFLTLVVTLIIEIPVLYMIAGGSDRLYTLLGRDRYQLLIAFLPLSSAISGNCGLQASTLAIRAISHLHVTRANYLSWLLAEIGVASVLGLGLGIVIGVLAYITSNADIAFACTMCLANFIGVLSAGLTGTLAPLICTFIFHRDASKWGGPLETVIQDNVATFVMVILSYNMLLWLGSDTVAN